VLPNKARNIALDRVETKYVAFCDNDLDYWPGWLDALVENAEVNGSAAVAPLILIGPSDPPVIHHAGGSLCFAKTTPAARCFPRGITTARSRCPRPRRTDSVRRPSITRLSNIIACWWTRRPRVPLAAMTSF